VGIVEIASVLASLSTAAALLLLWRQNQITHRSTEATAALEFTREFNRPPLLRARIATLDLHEREKLMKLPMPVEPQVVLDFLQAVCAATTHSVMRKDVLADNFGWWIGIYWRVLAPYMQQVQDLEAAEYWPDFARLGRLGMSQDVRFRPREELSTQVRSERSLCSYQLTTWQ
jgi:hypothetical protein